jgi:hypothetical protein
MVIHARLYKARFIYAINQKEKKKKKKKNQPP